MFLQNSTINALRYSNVTQPFLYRGKEVYFFLLYTQKPPIPPKRTGGGYSSGLRDPSVERMKKLRFFSAILSEAPVIGSIRE